MLRWSNRVVQQGWNLGRSVSDQEIYHKELLELVDDGPNSTTWRATLDADEYARGLWGTDWQAGSTAKSETTRHSWQLNLLSCQVMRDGWISWAVKKCQYIYLTKYSVRLLWPKLTTSKFKWRSSAYLIRHDEETDSWMPTSAGSFRTDSWTPTSAGSFRTTSITCAVQTPDSGWSCCYGVGYAILLKQFSAELLDFLVDISDDPRDVLTAWHFLQLHSCSALLDVVIIVGGIWS